MGKLRGIFCFLLLLFTISFFPGQTVSSEAEGSYYHLPYPNGTRVFEIQGPFSQSPEANHSYFAFDSKGVGRIDDGKPALVSAARSGWVVYKKDCEDGLKEVEANLLVLGHGPKSPDGQYQEYSWYMHLQKDSIPDDIMVGDYIRCGTIIGREGHNGKSTGVHLHFGVTAWFDPGRFMTEGVPGCLPKAYHLNADGSREYLYIPFKFYEYENVEQWPEGKWVGSKNLIYVQIPQLLTHAHPEPQ